MYELLTWPANKSAELGVLVAKIERKILDDPESAEELQLVALLHRETAHLLVVLRAYKEKKAVSTEIAHTLAEQQLGLGYNPDELDRAYKIAERIMGYDETRGGRARDPEQVKP